MRPIGRRITILRRPVKRLINVYNHEVKASHLLAYLRDQTKKVIYSVHSCKACLRFLCEISFVFVERYQHSKGAIHLCLRILRLWKITVLFALKFL
jgi:hypothetical protein